MSRRDFMDPIHSSSYDYISPLRLDYAGRNVIVTGSALADGVGYATATAFARAGASGIALVDLHEITGDLIENLKQLAVDADVLVNNAAHMEPYTPVLAAVPSVYWRTWEVNLRGLFNMTRAFAPSLLTSKSLSPSQGLCTIINVASSGALSARAGSSGYRTSKLAILRWTEALQLEYADQGLLAFCINPGAIRTQLTVHEPEAIRSRLPHTPGVAGDTIVWLAAERREWLGGRYVSCPWDMEEFLGRKDEIIAGDELKAKMVF